MEKSIGELRVRTEFNPSNADIVSTLKQKSAELINLCDSLKSTVPENRNPEQMRLISLAQTAYEEAAMWAVKAATFG